MNIVDSSCWLEFFAGSLVGDEVGPIIEDTKNLLVPSITIYEVFKKLFLELDEDKALFAIAHMKQGTVINLDTDGAIYAAKIGKENTLSMADSIIYAVTQKYDAVLWTQDKHFKDLPSVHYFEKGL
ncbi:MAG: type II toxin-antitoxin system VapC family toxin [Rectinema sp.]